MRLISLTLLALLAADIAPAQRQSREDHTIHGPHGEVLSRDGDFVAAVGGRFSGAAAPRGSAVALPKGVYKITLNNTGTGWAEQFVIGVPTNPQSPAPLLTIFHGYGETPEDMVYNTSYFQEAMARGWIVIAPLGAHKFNYAIDYAQTNIEQAINWAATWLTLDPDRFYAVGFSMGGGMASSFAARHLETYGPRFAAVVVHTGTTSIADTYWNANAGGQAFFENPLMFGASPVTDPFRYSTASSIDLDTVTNTVDQTTDLLRNLTHVPTYHFAALGDPNPELVNQTAKSHAQLQLRDGDSSYVTSNDTVHQWWTLDETTILDWLDPQRYQQPDQGELTRTLADRSARWFDIYIQQAVAGEFTPFRWTALTQLNRMYIDEVANADLLSFDPALLGLDRGKPLEYVVNNTDGLALDLVLEGYAQIPSDVKRNGVSTGAWSYDAAKRTVTLFETNAATYPLWRIEP
jgi:poly(3-hydroxybutyrate) depolymerase